LGNKNEGGDDKRLMGYFGCKDGEQLQRKISSIQKAFSQGTSDEDRKTNFVQFLRKNADIRQALEEISQEQNPYANMLSFVFFLKNQEKASFGDFLFGSLAEANEVDAHCV
jgi:hypothetical protein